MTFCKQCGAQLEPGAVTCPQCGLSTGHVAPGNQAEIDHIEYTKTRYKTMATVLSWTIVVIAPFLIWLNVSTAAFSSQSVDGIYSFPLQVAIDVALEGLLLGLFHKIDNCDTSNQAFVSIIPLAVVVGVYLGTYVWPGDLGLIITAPIFALGLSIPGRFAFGIGVFFSKYLNRWLSGSNV